MIKKEIKKIMKIQDQDLLAQKKENHISENQKKEKEIIIRIKIKIITIKLKRKKILL